MSHLMIQSASNIISSETIMSELTLYWSLGSQPGRAVKTLIDIGKIPCTLNSIDILQQQQRKKAYLQIYPAGKIPVLKQGDFVLGQSGAIMIYLCERYPHIAKYHGQTIQQRAIVNQYIAWYQNYFRPALFKPIRMYLSAVLMNQSISEQHKTALWRNMYDAIQKLDTILAKNGTKFIAGETPTIADFLLYYQMTNLVYFGQNHQKYMNLKRWFIEVYRVNEVKAITHEWYPIAKNLSQMFSNAQVQKAKL